MKQETSIGFYKTTDGLMAYVGMRVPQPLAGTFEWCGWVRNVRGDHLPEAWDSKGKPMLHTLFALQERVRADHFKSMDRTRSDWNAPVDCAAEDKATLQAEQLRKEEIVHVE